MEWIPLILFILFAGFLYGTGSLIYAAIHPGPRARRLNLAGMTYGALILLIGGFLLWGKVIPGVIFGIAGPIAVSGLGYALSFRHKFRQGSFAAIGRHKKKICVALLACLGIASLWLMLKLFEGVDDQLTFQIKPGMTRNQVTAILGKPQTSESEDRLWGYYIRDFGPTAFMFPFCVSFDENGKVADTWVQ